MAHVIRDRVYESTSTTGTGSFTLTGVVDASYRTFGSVMANGDTCRYLAIDATGLTWETGVGTWATGGTLARTTVEDGSSGTSAVSFANAPKVFLVNTAEAMSGCYYLNGTLISGNRNTLPQVDVWTNTSGTITKHPNARRISGRLIGGGGGGGSGSSGALSTSLTGGGGGGGGAHTQFDMAASSFGASLTVTFSANTGAGGAAVTGAVGIVGQQGATVSLAATNSTLYAYGGKGGGAGTLSAGSVGGDGGSAIGQGSIYGGGPGGSGSQPTSPIALGAGSGGGGCSSSGGGNDGGSVLPTGGASGGGSGGGWAANNTNSGSFPGRGGVSPFTGYGTSGTLAANGPVGLNSALEYGPGGGGSGAGPGATGTTGFTGGAGGLYGGGGGGGSAVQPATATSGAGGAGGSGIAYVVQS